MIANRTLRTLVSSLPNQSLDNSSNLLTSSSLRLYSTRLAEVGKLEPVQKDEQCYLAGQTFIHRVFGYRGVTLFPWLAKIHDIDASKHYKESSGIGVESQDKNDESGQQSRDTTEEEGDDSLRIGDKAASSSRPGRYHPYYQVLIDTRDCPFVSHRTQTEAVTFLGHPENSKAVCSIKGLDYVAHEDIMPYTSYETQPISHELFNKLFKSDPNSDRGSKFSPTDLLDSWRSRHPWLSLSQVYKETTEGIKISLIPFYLGHTTIENIAFHWWRYCVRLENFGGQVVTLRERHWKIYSRTSMVQTIKGRGVVGVEPSLTKEEPAYQYSSHVNLQDKSGHMWGTFKMQREDGHTFECRIPKFQLLSQETK